MRPSFPAIASVGRALPANYVDQDQLIGAFRTLWSQGHFNVERLEDLHRAVQVKGRYLALPLEEYLPLDTFQKRNDAWIRCALDLSEVACRDALSRAGLTPKDVDHVFFVTVTGIATPSIDARLVNRLGMRPDVKRTPIFGLGCVAGAAGTARAADYLKAYPRGVAMVVSAELCSLTLQREDLSVANIIASGLFADGASAAVLTGAEHQVEARGPRVVATRSVFYPDSERIMGWDVVDTGFKVVLSARVPNIVRDHLRGDVDGFLSEHGLRRPDIKHWIAHTGGPKVLDGFAAALELPPDALTRSWESLHEIGNLSSSSVLFVLSDFLRDEVGQSGELGVLMAMGPGFCSEMVLLQW